MTILEPGMIKAMFRNSSNGPAHGKMVLITWANSKGSGEPAHPRSLTSLCCSLTASDKELRVLSPLGSCACAFEGSRNARRLGPFSRKTAQILSFAALNGYGPARCVKL